VILCFGWAACPYTAFALESNTNDALVSLTLVAALLALDSAPARGVLLALSSMTKFAPIPLAPLFATYGATERGSGGLRRYVRVAAPFVAAFAVTVLVVSAQALFDPGLDTYWHRTIAEQGGRDSPFSVWGQSPSLGWLQAVVKAGVVGLALLVAFRPKLRDPVTVAALGTALLIGMELVIDHWFYLYIPWFLPFLLIALLGGGVVELGGGDHDRVDPASEPVVSDLDRGTHHPDVVVGGVEAHRHLRAEGL
jgi:hypothetical protein